MTFKSLYKKVLICLTLINFFIGFSEGVAGKQFGIYFDDYVPSTTSYLKTNISVEDGVNIVRYDTFFVNYSLSDALTDCVFVTFKSVPKTITNIPAPRWICSNSTSFYVVQFTANESGIVTIAVEAEPINVLNTEDAFFTLSAKVKPEIDTISDVIGWIYTIAWDISFLPQIIHNWRRQSVIGLSFDFLSLNMLGFACYFFFNMGLYWIDAIQVQYELRHPTSFLHVRLNDVIFPLYACICTAIQIIQCFIYERGNQRVSTICRTIIFLLTISIGVFAILVGTVEKIWWLDFLYWLSYIKLAITCIKYTPQLLENYRNKSTEGWSIWQVLLDFTGGSFSLLQMFLLAYNYGDFHSVLTDPSKLGLGLLSIFFNIFFIIQHYCLYRNNYIENVQKRDSIDKEKQTAIEVFQHSTKPYLPN